jgi:flavin reductase (DIM6/NTAB) family NADH-FMN oxidoreductase RutF
VKRLLRELIYGEGLRHRPVGLRAADQHPVQAVQVSAASERDVSRLVFPVSLSPLVLGLARTADEPVVGPFELRMVDASGERLGSIALTPAGSIEHAYGVIDLARPTDVRVRCVPRAYRAWRYLTAWRHAQLTKHREHAFSMDLPDLKALNVFYMMPRPVYLVSVVHEGRDNIFPMDLVGPLGENLFLLALRKTSPSIELMRTGGRIVLSGMPARFRDVVYRLAIHHKKLAVDWSALELAIQPSPRFGFPVPAEALDWRELRVVKSEETGSHVLFVTEVESCTDVGDEPQLCHVSDMYARWRAASGRPFEDA